MIPENDKPPPVPDPDTHAKDAEATKSAKPLAGTGAKIAEAVKETVTEAAKAKAEEVKEKAKAGIAERKAKREEE